MRVARCTEHARTASTCRLHPVARMASAWAARALPSYPLLGLLVGMQLAAPTTSLASRPLQSAAAGGTDVSEQPAPPPTAALKLDPILGSGMVLPANDAQLWGTATPHAALTVSVTSAGSKSLQFHGTADATGHWRMNVSVPATGLRHYNLTVVASSAAAPSLHADAPTAAAPASTVSTTLVDVLFGAVTICKTRQALSPSPVIQSH